MKLKILVINLLLINILQAQNDERILIHNAQAISGFYDELYQLEDGTIDKIRITHIGDSHIQADFFTDNLRQHFQKSFGNGGLGFSFPHNLIYTYANKEVKYFSNVRFKTTRITKPRLLPRMGLSGYEFISPTENTAIYAKIKNKKYEANSIKVFYSADNDLHFVNYIGNQKFKNFVPQKTYKIYKVKKGDYLGRIARKYHKTVKELKKFNKMRTNMLRIGQKIKIPTKAFKPTSVNPNHFIRIDSTANAEQGSSEFATAIMTSEKPISEFYLFSKNINKNLSINALYLENNQRGIVYSAIGVNGATAADYNKYPLFFKQLQALQSDLYIISLGTNESIGKVAPEIFINSFLNFIRNIRQANPNAQILVTTPPPSMIKKRHYNKLLKPYIQLIFEQMQTENYAVWDMFKVFGGFEGIKKNAKRHYLAKDRIHFTKAGYDKQGDLFYQAIIYHYTHR